MDAKNLPGRDRSVAVTYGWLWPGLPPLWVGGEWRGLGWAVGFALMIEALILTALVWNEWFDPFGKGCLAVGAAVYWLVGVRGNRRWAAEQVAGPAAAGDLFPEALAEYLQGNWLVAEKNCRILVGRRRTDVEARLLLATTLRRLGRRDEARAELDALEKIEGAERWSWETAGERKLLDAAAMPDEPTEEPATAVTGEPIRRAA